MVYPVHNRFVVRGHFGTTEEIWSYGLHFPSDVSGGPDSLPGNWNESAVTAAVNAFHGASHFATSTFVDGWRGYHIGADGRTIGDELHRVDYGSPVGGAGQTRHPPQVALVVSLRGASRGTAQNGRCYLPGLVLAVDNASLTISAAAAGAVLASFKTFIEALKNAMYDPLVSNEELVNVSKVGTGRMQDVVTYRCGVVYDTIRTRRNALVENYVELSA